MNFIFLKSLCDFYLINLMKHLKVTYLNKFYLSYYLRYFLKFIGMHKVFKTNLKPRHHTYILMIFKSFLDKCV